MPQPAPRRRRTRLVVVLIVVPVLLVVAVAGAGTYLFFRLQQSLPSGWHTAGFVVASQDQSVRDEVGQLLVARTGGQARYVVRPRGVVVGVPPAEQDRLGQLVAQLPVHASVSLRPVLEGAAGDKLRSLDGKTSYPVGPAALTGERVTTAGYQTDQTGSWVVQVSFDSAGAQQLATVTGQLQGKQLAIVAADVVVAAPEVQQAIAGGELQISGKFTENEVRGIAAAFLLGRNPLTISAGDPG